MAATGITITADMFHTLMLKKQAQVGIVVEDPFKSIYQDVKSTALTLMLPFSLPVGGMIQVGGNSGKGIGTGGADANVSWGDFTVTRLRWNRPFPVDKDSNKFFQYGQENLRKYNSKRAPSTRATSRSAPAWWARPPVVTS